MRLPHAFISLLLGSVAFAFNSQHDTMLDDFIPVINEMPSLNDLLTVEPSASIFFAYARELELSRLFQDSFERMTLLVPTNKAIMALSHKPHESAFLIEQEINISEQAFDSMSKANVERWISAHIIPVSPISLSSKTYETLFQGHSVTFSPVAKNDGQGPEWARVMLNDGLRIVAMREASNGVLYLIDGTVLQD